jgi:ubiquinone biosynthesis protein
MFSRLWWTFLAACMASARLAVALVLPRRTSAADILGRTLAELLERLGPAFIKFGQLLGTRPDLIADEFAAPLRALQDRLPPLPPRVARTLVARELGAPVDAWFAEFADVPVASGSIAAVHRARRHDGRIVAVKVLRPGVAAAIERDLRLLRRIVAAAERLPVFRDLPLVAAVDQLGESLRGQTDLRREAAANARLRLAFSANGKVVIPGVIEALSTPAVLTMDFIDAFAQPATRHDASDPLALRVGLRALYQMIFIDGVVHCDMHEGNFRLLPDGRVALIDFGFVAEMDTETRLSFAEFFMAMASGDGAWCADIALQMAARYPPAIDRAAFARAMGAIVAPAAGRRVAEFSVASFVAALFNVQRRYQVCATPAFVMAIVALLTFEGLAKEIDVALDFQREALPFVAGAGIWDIGARAGDAASVRRRFQRNRAASGRGHQALVVDARELP